MLITKGLHSHFPLAVYICTRLSPSLPPSKRAAVRPIQLLHDDGDRDGDREMAADSFSSLPSSLPSPSFFRNLFPVMRSAARAPPSRSFSEILHKARVLMQRLGLSFVSETVLSDRIQSCHSKTIVENHLDSDVKSRASYATLLCNVSVCPLLRSAARCLAVSPNLVRSTRLVLSYGMAASASAPVRPSAARAVK